MTYEKTQVGTVAIVTPWLDEPPVFALLEGGAALVAERSTPQQANDAASARIPVIALSLISLMLAALLLLRLFGHPGVALTGIGAPRGESSDHRGQPDR